MLEVLGLGAPGWLRRLSIRLSVAGQVVISESWFKPNVRLELSKESAEESLPSLSLPHLAPPLVACIPSLK